MLEAYASLAIAALTAPVTGSGNKDNALPRSTASPPIESLYTPKFPLGLRSGGALIAR